MSLENVELVRSLQPGPDMDVAGILADEEATAGWLEEVAPFFDADVQCTMRFPGMAPVTYAGGVEGLADAWRDWLRAWSSFRFDVEEVLDGATASWWSSSAAESRARAPRRRCSSAPPSGPFATGASRGSTSTSPRARRSPRLG